MYKNAILLVLILCQLPFIKSQSFKCPKISRYNEPLEIANVCSCSSKLIRIECYNLGSFTLVPQYTDFIRSSLTYDRLHLNSFRLCYNLNYNANQQVPLVHIGAQLMSELSFSSIMVEKCDNKDTNPIQLKFETNFLEMQTETLHRLEIEIPIGIEHNGSQVLLDLAQAMALHKRLEYMVVWMDVNLYLHIPDYWFGEFSPNNFFVLPILEILLTNHHFVGKNIFKVRFILIFVNRSSFPLEDDQDVSDNQEISIGSFAFLNLKRLRLLTFQNVLVRQVAKSAFAAINSISRQITINFTSCYLQKTIFYPESFTGLNRVATAYFAISNSDNFVKQKLLFIPSKEVFSKFLLENAENKIVVDYPIDCGKKSVQGQLKWMLENNNTFSIMQIEIKCTTGKSIFEYFKVTN